MRRGRLLAPVLAVALLLAGCSEQGLQEPDGREGDSGVTEWRDPPAAVAFSGPTVDGSTFDSKDHRGDVVVVNFWYQDCPPCNREAPVLTGLAERFASDDVQFVGVNVRDGAPDATAFERRFDIEYPSILDMENGAAAQLAFRGTIGPRTIPSTVVLDRKGRPVSRITGAVDESVLRTLVQDAVDGRAA